jgi:hypothetical protein
MNPTLLEYFAAHEQLSAQDMRNIHSTIPDELRSSRDAYEDEVASKRAMLRFIRAKEMVEEAEANRTWHQEMKCEPWPKPHKTTGLSFSEALAAMKGGENIRRIGSGYSWHVLDSKFVCRYEDGSLAPAMFSRTEIMADDWEVVP